jgi:hypothetical protein
VHRHLSQGRLGRTLAILALATYGSAGLFGYGLHTLWECEHGLGGHCQAGIAQECCNHSHDHAAWHGHHDAPTPAGSSVTSNSVASNCDDCSICSFLAQAQTSVLPTFTLDGVEPLCVAPQFAESLLSLSSDAPLARGPPRA